MIRPDIGHPVAPADAHAAKRVREPRYPREDLAVRDGASLVHDRDALRRHPSAPRRPGSEPLVAHQLFVIPSSRAALSLRISGRTSGLMSSASKSASHRSGVITGKSEP